MNGNTDDFPFPAFRVRRSGERAERQRKAVKEEFSPIPLAADLYDPDGRAGFRFGATAGTRVASRRPLKPSGCVRGRAPQVECLMGPVTCEMPRRCPRPKHALQRGFSWMSLGCEAGTLTHVHTHIADIGF